MTGAEEYLPVEEEVNSFMDDHVVVLCMVSTVQLIFTG